MSILMSFIIFISHFCFRFTDTVAVLVWRCAFPSAANIREVDTSFFHLMVIKMADLSLKSALFG